MSHSSRASSTLKVTISRDGTLTYSHTHVHTPTHLVSISKSPFFLSQGRLSWGLGKDKKALGYFTKGLEITGKHQLLLDSALLNQAVGERLLLKSERDPLLESANNMLWICGALGYRKEMKGQGDGEEGEGRETEKEKEKVKEKEKKGGGGKEGGKKGVMKRTSSGKEATSDSHKISAIHGLFASIVRFLSHAHTLPFSSFNYQNFSRFLPSILSHSHDLISLGEGARANSRGSQTLGILSEDRSRKR